MFAERIREGNTEFEREEVKIGSPKGIYAKRKICFRDKNMPTDASGFRTNGWARVPILGLVVSAAASGGKYDKHLDVKHPDWEVGAIGSEIYQSAVMILREIGHYSMGVRSIDEDQRLGNADLRQGMRTDHGRPCVAMTGC